MPVAEPEQEISNTCFRGLNIEWEFGVYVTVLHRDLRGYSAEVLVAGYAHDTHTHTNYWKIFVFTGRLTNP